MYYIGIDFGHGETCASRTPGYGGEDVSQIALRNNADVKKVMSAICQRDGQWHLVYNQNDFKSPNLSEGFKGRISELRRNDPESLNALREFGKLIFSTILQNDGDLQYDEQTGDANFVICIANPSEWRMIDSQSPDEYLRFFREECGIKPAILCINESDAAFFTKYTQENCQYAVNDTVFVIDLGSSTIDFTTYCNSKCITNGCWGHNLGAHIIDDAILDRVVYAESYRDLLNIAQEFRNELGIDGNLNAALSLIARQAKERFYSDPDSDTFDLTIRMVDLVPRPFLTQHHLEYIGSSIQIDLNRKEFDELIAGYKDQLALTINNAATHLRNNVMVSPDYVVLSGGASRMNFVRELTRQYFPNAKINIDQTPEWVVSNGAAKYIRAQQSALKRLLEAIRKIDYKKIYKDADITATQKATMILLPSVIGEITGSSNLTGIDMLQEFCDFFFDLNSQNERYVQLFNESANALLRDNLSKSIKEVIMSEFHIDVDMTDITIQYNFVVMNWKPEFWGPIKSNGEIVGFGPGCKKIMQAIDDSSERFDFTWDKQRDLWERKKIAEGCKIRFSGRDPFGVAFDEEDLQNAAKDICNQTLEIAERLFYEKELFITTHSI